MRQRKWWWTAAVIVVLLVFIDVGDARDRKAGVDDGAPEVLRRSH